MGSLRVVADASVNVVKRIIDESTGNFIDDSHPLLERPHSETFNARYKGLK
ncbi:MAG: hypothetical protein OEM06_09705 [Desulfobacteraceae bacterium]|nr:hypothetical protein [Desulfobacteraceae bacterium]MDH3575080.1 hypothetical protein [Desulfobacteraceae bacterium]MDH3722478.1 hypothetical protein [Desulfobacteraceae bacterium]MDH3837655.1 hypothetical protein [Desulfobacteraceae bacterium]MDH3875460.1 hypothetical protein [Desulfobacteraceae bacterium]